MLSKKTGKFEKIFAVIQNIVAIYLIQTKLS